MKKLISIISISIILLALWNCRKKDDDMNASPSSNNVQVSMDGAEGIFWTWKEYKLDHSGPMPYTNTINYGSAAVDFFNGPFPNYTQWLDVGDVYCEGINIRKIGLHGFGAIYSSDTNINFNQNVTWIVQGNTSFKGFNFTDTTGFPYMSEIKSKDTLKRNSDFTISFDTLINADSIILKIFEIDTVISGKVNSITIKKSQIQLHVPDGAEYYGEFFLMPYSHSAHLINGKKYYFQNRFLRYKGLWTVGK